LGVVLSTISLVGTVECDDLVAENIWTRSKSAWDVNCPRVVVGNQVVGGPDTWVGTANVSNTIDLEEFETGLVNCRAVTVTARQVICVEY
jgi:hypothetical protein